MTSTPSAERGPSTEESLLLSVSELGGYPDFTSVYEQAGYRVQKIQTIRKALAALKRIQPAVVVAEFNYAPTYGARISTIEPLLARLQSHHPEARVLLFLEKDNLGHLDTLRPQYGTLDHLTYPIWPDRLQAWLQHPP